MFREIYGQEGVKKVIGEIINSGNVPHALLFSGNAGVGKDYMAITFAKELNKKYLKSGEGEYILNQISQLSEPYIKFIFPLPRGKNEKEDSGPLEKLSDDEIAIVREEMGKKSENPYHQIEIPKANIIKISSIREIKRFVSYDFSDIRYRIIIISGAHLMNEESQNALLKNLEEPPEGIIFILTTPYPGILRETIRSRCWSINFNPLAPAEVKEILITKFDVNKEDAEQASLFSEGSVSEALNLLEHELDNLLDKTILILRYSMGRKYHSAFEQFKELLEDGDSDTIKLICRMIIIWLNDVQKEKYGVEGKVFKRHSETIEKFLTRFPDLNFNETIVKLDRLVGSIKNNVNTNIIVSNIVFTLGALTYPKKRKV